MQSLYFGTKQVLAQAMTRQEYNDYRGWQMPSDEDGTDPGYLVEVVDVAVSNHPAHIGYISWSPKEVFENSFQHSSTRMTFGHAIEALKAGWRVARTSWNGKGLWLELQRPDTYSKMTLPYIYLNYPDDALHTPGARVPWLALQTDMLAEDWMILSDGHPTPTEA